MLSKENLLRMDDMTPDKVAAIERLLAEYSLRLGMSSDRVIKILFVFIMMLF